MADFSATHNPQIRRRTHGVVLDNTLTATILRLGERKQELADKAQEYDRALRQSQHAATARKRSSGTSGVAGSVVAGNGTGMVVASGGASSSIWQSGVGGAAMVQTAVLGDSHGSVELAPPLLHNEPIHDTDLVADGGVGSELGDSYVDGKRSKGITSQQDDGDDDDEMGDGGVLGLLAQIYGTKGQGPARVI